MTLRRFLLPLVLAVLCVPGLAAALPRAHVRAVDQSVRARQAYDAGQFERAANLYRLAYQLDPAEPTYLYGVGKSEQMAGRCGVADTAFAELKARLPADHPILARATAAELLCHPPAPPPAPAAAAPAPAPAPAIASVVLLPAVVTEPAAPSAPAPASPQPTTAWPAPQVDARAPAAASPWTLWAGLGVGVVAGVTGAWAGWATSDLDQQTGRMSPGDARDRQQTINSASTAAAVLGGLAVAGIGHGLWSVWHGTHDFHGTPDSRATPVSLGRGRD